MTAEVIDGKAFAAKLRARVGEHAANFAGPRAVAFPALSSGQQPRIAMIGDGQEFERSLGIAVVAEVDEVHANSARPRDASELTHGSREVQHVLERGIGDSRVEVAIVQFVQVSRANVSGDNANDVGVFAPA